MNWKDFNNIQEINNYDDDIIAECMANTYKLLFDDWELEEILDVGGQYFLFNPCKREIPVKILEQMLEYFETKEQYEKCSKIKKTLDNYNKHNA